MERDWVVQAQAGDVEAFSRLVRITTDRLHNVAYRILRDQDAADDATQRALIAAWDHLRDLRDPDRWVAWTYRLVVNAAYREARHERSQRARVKFIAPSLEGEGDSVSRVADRDQLERAFRALSADHRAVLVLHHYVGLSQSEIADVLGIPVGTVGSRLHHATRRLRAAYDADTRTAFAGGHAA